MVEWVGVMKENLGFGRMKVGDGKNKCLMEEGEESIVAIGMEKDFRRIVEMLVWLAVEFLKYGCNNNGFGGYNDCGGHQ